MSKLEPKTQVATKDNNEKIHTLNEHPWGHNIMGKSNSSQKQ
jgi:hypothetical protein